MRLRERGRLRILDLDIETRRVGFHQGGRFGPDGCEPITIAASWVGESAVHVWLQPENELPEILEAFRELYDAADLVTGHYIRKFDLPVLNAAMFEHDLPILGQKLAHDTKSELVSLGGISKSQENLSGTMDLPTGKYHMGDYKWRRAARLDPRGVAEGRRRAVSDVRQHKRMRLALLDRGVLKEPRVWRP